MSERREPGIPASSERGPSGPSDEVARARKPRTNVPARLHPSLAPDSPVQQLARLLVDAGHECFLVGGSVRDALLDRGHDDVDIATSARPAEVEAIVRPWADDVWLQGQRFGTVGCI